MDVSRKNLTIPAPSASEESAGLAARAYQTELMEQAKTENLIVCLPTGSGKTYIAVMLIKELSSAVRQSVENGGKRTVFLVKTVQLVDQQSAYIRTHTDLRVGVYYGDMGVDNWNGQRWKDEFESHQVLVFTAQVFLNILNHNHFSLSKVNLLIFDECHHATGENQYASLMNHHYDNCTDKPRILGLTASISNQKIKPKDLAVKAQELEKTYRARIESGSSRQESIQHGTSAAVEPILCSSYQSAVLNTNGSLTIPFDILRQMIKSLQITIDRSRHEIGRQEERLSYTMLTSDYRGENIATYNTQSSNYTTLTRLFSLTLPRVKRYLENFVEIGYELGLLALVIFGNDLRKKLKAGRQLLCMISTTTRETLDDCLERLDCLMDDVLIPLYRLNNMNLEVLFSPKVIKLLERIHAQQKVKDREGRCIVFVERTYTAAILCQVLTDLAATLTTPLTTPLRIKHVTGTQAGLGENVMTPKYQRETIKEFRTAKVNVLIATAVVEEGLDIPQCDLVIRFNKPMNFSSYMQSKGRVRAKQNASYVLFMDESNVEAYDRDQMEYDNYEEIEQMIEDGCVVATQESSSADDPSHIAPYRPSEGIVIDATRAAQLITDYCIILGSGQPFPPRFLFHGVASPYTCILSMPANCPVRDDIKRENRRKKLAKYECCLKMVELLHQRGEFDESCLPKRNREAIIMEVPIENQIFRLVDELFEKKSDSSFELYSKQVFDPLLTRTPTLTDLIKAATFPAKKDQTCPQWHLYRADHQLGLVAPCSSIPLPQFLLYGHREVFPVQITYIKPVDCCKTLEDFCQYLFEHVFSEMNIGSALRFDLSQSTFKLLPCLLTDAGEIDTRRMSSILHRQNRPVQTHSELCDDELYYAEHLNHRQWFTHMSDASLLKRPSDSWPHKKDADHIRTYADFFAYKLGIGDCRRDTYLATMKGVRKQRINYLQETPRGSKEETTGTSSEVNHFAIECLRYAPLNGTDMDLFYRLPSLLVRVAQLSRIEQLRRLLADELRCYKFLDANLMPVVTFKDYLKNTDSMNILPLTPLTYETLSRPASDLQPSTDLLFQSITRRSTDEITDMENLEILGDCFLKLAVSMCFYHRYPLAGAGALTIEKCKQISNGNLYRIAVQKQLKRLLYTSKVTFRGGEANWLPPGYTAVASKDSLGPNPYTQQRVKRKAFADMLEAFIGAYLVSTDYTTTLSFMAWLGLDVIPWDAKKQIIALPSIVCSNFAATEIDSVIDRFYAEQSFADVEKKINYRFRHRAYLIAAFTHPSSFANRLTSCYERLEFLGDAVLDFLVTRHIFNENKSITPGRVTDIRQDLSNNGRLAYILVACGLHRKILHNSPDLFGKMTMYAGDDTVFPRDASTEELLSKDIAEWADSTAPKALADVFEALVGAIFLDSGECLRTVWNVVEPLLRQYIDRSITDPNLNPVRSFFEQQGKVVSEYTQVDSTSDKKVSYCIVERANGDQVLGRGENKKAAKSDACRKAIRLTKSNL